MTPEEKERTASYRTPVDDEYGSCERTCAVLRVYSGGITPADVTALLGINPTSTVGIGERSRPNSLGLSRVGKLNGWFLSTESAVPSKDLRHHLDWLNVTLRQISGKLRTLQESPEIKMSVNCIWWSKHGGGGPTLWPEQMRGLADLNLECSFDFQYYGEREDEATTER